MNPWSSLINTESPPPSFGFAKHILVPVLVMGIALGVAYVLFGKTIVEKSLSSLAMPAGLIWLTLLASTYIAITRKQRLTAVVTGLCLALVWLFGTFPVANSLIKNLERPFLDFELEAMEKLDVVVVLGGGTSTNTNGHVQLGSAGDRVAMAAQVFHAGKTDSLICTGTRVYRRSPEELHYGEEARSLLLSFGVPADVVITVEGANTSEEMKNLKEWAAEQPTPPRIGILTSAWHLSRAMRLANAAGLEATPIPSDFRSRHGGVSPDWIIPSSNNIHRSSLAVKEYLARLIGR